MVIFYFLLLAGFWNDVNGQELGIEAEGDLIWSDEFEGTGEPDAAKWERQEYNRRNNENGPDGWWVAFWMMQGNVGSMGNGVVS